MYLVWVLICVATTRALAYVQHCMDPVQCQFFPLHTCYATDEGLICRGRDKPGFELNANPAFTVAYTANYNRNNDTGLPCFSIPITDELISYAEYRGDDVLKADDLPLVGNCSQVSYCDPKTRTCQPKKGLGSRCQYNMQCMYSKENIPGNCNQTVCSVRPELPAYYYTDTQQWKMGDEWPAAVLALVVSGVVVLSILAGRYLIPNLLKKIKAALERWQNKSERLERCENEQIWNEHHTWWNKVPVLRWVYGRWKKPNVDYYQLENRTGEGEPPPYRAD